ncbi:MAG: hypothetical protein QM820_04955 [Minicystis sp.]
MESASTAPSSEPGEERETKRRETPPEESPFRKLLHRWFVEYNPLYLVSALLVLGGLTVISRSTAESSSTEIQTGAVAAIAEIYAVALIAGAALLTRIGLRRPAVMLCLVTALYQGDLTLLTERQVYLGLSGALAVAVWLVLFVAKIHALAWAMRLRLSRSAVAVPAFGALGMVILPHVLQHGDARTRSAVVAVWVFALFAGGLWTSREVTSKVSLDAWGQTVLARTLRAMWVMWAMLVSMHVLFWCDQFGASPAVLVPVAFLLATRWMQREGSVWCTAAGAILVAGAVEPRALWVVSSLSAATLALRALRRPTMIEHGAEAPNDAAPYRASGSEAPPPRVEFGFARADRASLHRLLTGSIFGVYLSAWTIGWSGGALPQHVMLLDAALLVALALASRRARAKRLLAPVVPTWLHAGWQAGIIVAPATALAWGITAVSSGFVLLLGSLLVAWRLRAGE